MDQAHERIADMGAVEGTGEERVLAVQDGLFQDSFPKVMPTPGLCRVPGANKPISGESRFLVIELSALSKALEEGKQWVGGLISSGHKAARMGMRERAFL